MLDMQRFSIDPNDGIIAKVLSSQNPYYDTRACMSLKILKNPCLSPASIPQRNFNEKCGRLLEATIGINTASKAKLPKAMDYLIPK